MKGYKKNLFYSLRIDQDLLEYKVQNSLIRSCFRFFRINTRITLPVNLIIRSRSKKARFGHFIEFTIKEHSNKRNSEYKETRLRKFWIVRRASLKRLLQEVKLNRTHTTETCYERVIHFPVINHKITA